MTKTLSTLLAGGLALALARSASAQPGNTQPGAQPAAPPSDQSDLSHIRGTPIPVGDHHRYHYRYRRLNVSANPVGWILGLYGVSGSYALGQNVALRADVNYFDFIDSDDTGFEFGVGAPIYFRRVYSGFFLEPGLIARRFDGGDGDVEGNTTVGPQVLVGWHWIWDSGLNLAVAAGVGRNWSSDDSEDSSHDDEELFPNGYLRFGYAF